MYRNSTKRVERRAVKNFANSRVLLNSSITRSGYILNCETCDTISAPAQINLLENYSPHQRTRSSYSSINPNFDNSVDNCAPPSSSLSDTKYKLEKWVIKNRITRSATSELLKILRQHKCFESVLPDDGRSLLATPRNIPIREIQPGQYCHFGLRRQLSSLLSEVFVEQNGNQFNLQFNLDGLPISKSSGQQFWPILGHIQGTKEVFEVGIYFGNEKPKLSCDFLSEFVEEWMEINKSGINIGTKLVNFEIDSLICDAPARAFILNAKNHTGYFGCGKCTVEVDYIKNRVVFLETNSALRTNESFRNKVDEENHHGCSELETLNLNLVDQIPFEFMHLVCLGVVKKLLIIWTSGIVKRVRISVQQRLTLSKNLINLKPHVPREFSRKPRSISELKRWKATEFRQFILYTGPLVLKEILPQKYYDHFLCLHFAISVLCSEELYKSHNLYAISELLKYFVNTFPLLYGDEQVSYNIHGLIHLASDSLKLGHLDDFSAFRFENRLGIIKQSLKGGNKPLEQVYNRICEQIKSRAPLESKNLKPTIKYNRSATEIMEIKYSHICLRPTLGDNLCLLKNGDFVKLTKLTLIEGEIICEARKLNVISPIYEIPASSNVISANFMKLTDKTIFSVGDIYKKCIGLAVNDKFAVFKLVC